MQWVAIVMATGLSVTAAWAAGGNQTIQSIEIEEPIAQCRKDCLEQTCQPHFIACVDTEKKAKPTCEAERATCEQRCIETDCMT